MERHDAGRAVGLCQLQPALHLVRHCEQVSVGHWHALEGACRPRCPEDARPRICGRWRGLVASANGSNLFERNARGMQPTPLGVVTLAYARRVALVPAELLMLHKAAVNRYLDILGIRAAEQSSADIDVIAHQTETVRNWMKASREKGLKSALTERDRPFAKKA